MHVTKSDISERLVNENVDYVVKHMNRYLNEHHDSLDICFCKPCLIDIAALTLNKVYSRYRLLGRHAHKDFVQVQKIYAEIHEAMLQAITIVKNCPHHE